MVFATTRIATVTPSSLADLDQRLLALKTLPIHRGRLLRAWLNGKPLGAGPRHLLCGVVSNTVRL
jgi:hypothetical protein